MSRRVLLGVSPAGRCRSVQTRLGLHGRRTADSAGSDRLISGFTLAELLVVVAVIVVLLAALLPALRAAGEQAKTVVCLTNLRQLSCAWALFPVDNAGAIIGAEIGADLSSMGVQGPPPQRDWVRSDFSGSHFYESETTMKNGAMWPYLRDIMVYRCPGEDRKSNWNGADYPYVRSYSIANYIGGGDFYWVSGGIRPAWKLTEISGPHSRLLFLDDSDPRGCNDGSWITYPASLASYGDWWCDWPAGRHMVGNAHSFADGSARQRPFMDSRTPLLPGFGVPAPNIADLRYFQHALWPSP